MTRKNTLAARLFGVVPTASRRAGPMLAYLCSFVMAWLYISDVAQARSLAGTVDEIGAVFWQWSLLLGSLIALVGIAHPRGRYSPALPLEAIGAMMVGLDVAIYIAVLAFNAAAEQPPYATLVWIGGVIPPMLWFRSVECMYNRGRLLLLETVRS